MQFGQLQHFFGIAGLQLKQQAAMAHSLLQIGQFALGQIGYGAVHFDLIGQGFEYAQTLLEQFHKLAVFFLGLQNAAQTDEGFTVFRTPFQHAAVKLAGSGVVFETRFAQVAKLVSCGHAITRRTALAKFVFQQVSQPVPTLQFKVESARALNGREMIGADGQRVFVEFEGFLRSAQLHFEQSGGCGGQAQLFFIVAFHDQAAAVNFHQLFVGGNTAADVTLEDGDILLVPRNTGTVYVYGQVNANGFIPWTQGKDFDWYIEKAGGFGTSASESRASVVKANTRAWLDPDETTIEPGDMIYVPHEPLVRLSTTSDILAVASAIVGGLAGIAGLVISVMR